MTKAVARDLERGRTARRRGDLREAARLVGQAFARAQRAGDEPGMARALLDVGLVALDVGDVDAAADAVSRALALARAAGDGELVAGLVGAAARVALASGDAATAVRLHAGAACLADGEALAAARAHVGGGVVEGARAQLGDAGVAAEEAAGAALDREAVLALAAARCAR